MLDKNKGLIDYGKDVLHYPEVKIDPFEIRMLLKENGYSVQRLEDHRTGEYRMIPDDARPVIVKLITSTGVIEFIYTSSNGKKQNKEGLQKLERNIEALLNLDGE